MSPYHLKEHGSGDSHPVQLDLKSGIKGEVSVIVTATPFGSVTAVVDVDIQGDGLLLGDCSSWRADGGRGRDRWTGWSRKHDKERWMV